MIGHHDVRVQPTVFRSAVSIANGTIHQFRVLRMAEVKRTISGGVGRRSMATKAFPEVAAAGDARCTGRRPWTRRVRKMVGLTMNSVAGGEYERRSRIRSGPSTFAGKFSKEAAGRFTIGRGLPSGFQPAPQSATGNVETPGASIGSPLLRSVSWMPLRALKWDEPRQRTCRPRRSSDFQQSGPGFT